MSDRPIFVFAALYSDRADAFADYDLLLEAHAAKLVGTYDVAIISKDAEGKVDVSKHEKPTQHGAWGGIAVGALVGVLFPPSVLGAAAVGGARRRRRGAPAQGHVAGRREGARRAARGGRGGADRDRRVARGRVARQGRSRAPVKSVEKEIDADNEEFKRELEDAAKAASSG